MNRLVKTAVLTAIALIAAGTFRAQAQHTLAVTAGYGYTTSRLYPKQETKTIWGAYSGGLSWRYYSLPRFVGCIGVDVEWMQRGFSYAPYASMYENKADYKYYTRRLNAIMVPLVWQPHFYLFRNHLRVYIEAAVTFSYNFASTFDNQETGTSGKYTFKTVRDNRFGFGLAGGGGIDFLIKQFEIGVRVRYDFGYADILRNRNKYYDNGLDQSANYGENPFWNSPLRSPLDNLTISLKFGFRFNKEGFKEWTVKKKPREKGSQTFKYTGAAPVATK